MPHIAPRLKKFSFFTHFVTQRFSLNIITDQRSFVLRRSKMEACGTRVFVKWSMYDWYLHNLSRAKGIIRRFNPARSEAWKTNQRCKLVLLAVWGTSAVLKPRAQTILEGRRGLPIYMLPFTDQKRTSTIRIISWEKYVEIKSTWQVITFCSVLKEPCALSCVLALFSRCSKSADWSM